MYARADSSRSLYCGDHSPPPFYRKRSAVARRERRKFTLPDIQLHKADTPWEPTRKTERNEGNRTDELYKKVRGILNKLTSLNFGTLVQQMNELSIDTEEKLKGVTDLVFEKAMKEPEFCVEYANMCRFLTRIKVPSETKKGEFVNFRALILTRCQLQFEKPRDFIAELEERRKEMKEFKDQENSEENLKAEYQLAETKTRLWKIGNIRFVGELFKLKMLTENIMHDCVFKLLQAKDDVSLESVCQLLLNIGKEIDTEKAKCRNDQYFLFMNKIVLEKRVSPRIRCLLQYVIDLRLNNWIDRQDEYHRNIFGLINEDAKRELLEWKISRLIPQKQSVRGRSVGIPRGTGKGPHLSGSKEKSGSIT